MLIDASDDQRFDTFDLFVSGLSLNVVELESNIQTELGLQSLMACLLKEAFFPQTNNKSYSAHRLDDDDWSSIIQHVSTALVAFTEHAAEASNMHINRTPSWV